MVNESTSAKRKRKTGRKTGLHGAPETPPEGGPIQDGILHTQHGDLAVIPYLNQRSDPGLWKPDAANSVTYFGMGAYAGRRVCGFEAAILDASQFPYFPMASEREDIAIRGRPKGVPEDVWTRCLAGDAPAMRQANRLRPGCIFLHDGTLTRVFGQTNIAASSPNSDEAFTAREWLKTALLPYVSYTRRGGQKETPRSGIGHVHLAAFWAICGSILLVRAIIRQLPSSRSKELRTHVLQYFPELGLLEGTTLVGADRKTWVPVIAGRHMGESAEDLDLLSPRVATFRLLKDVTGFSEKHISLRLRALNQHVLQREISLLHRWAAEQALTLIKHRRG